MKNYELPVPVSSEYEEFMLKEIDSFLGISAKFSPEGAKRIKITCFVSCTVIAAALFFAARIFNYPKLYWFMAFFLAMALAFSTYGNAKGIS